MPKNNSKARKLWRKDRAEIKGEEPTPEERLLRAIFAEPSHQPKPGTDES